MRIFFTIPTVFMVSSLTFADNSLFEKREFVFKGDTLRYRVLFPENYDKNRDYPLVLFLHGSGERGSDNEKQLTHGAALFVDEENRKDYPSIVIFPQCPQESFWVERERLQDQSILFPEKPKITKPLFLVKKLMDS